MKKILAVLSLVFLFNVAGQAQDQFFYGAWWTTAIKPRTLPKQAGEFYVTLHGTAGASGTGTLSSSSATQVFDLEVNWVRYSKNPNILVVYRVTPLFSAYTSWSGKVNSTTGALVGTWGRSDKLAKGKFQASLVENP